ncbi:MAG: DNA polymerase III subunit delta [Erysipelotrichaceae bacterium]|jgi:DNA polymerase-3 subunit delta|nr:DNA polymerase III subunit delta [Erysipelotrichaceae bacterium]
MAILLYGNQQMMIKNQLKKLIKEQFSNENERNVVRFDALETNVEEVVNECCQFSLEFAKKMVILDNAQYFSNSRTKAKINISNKFDILLNYLKNENPDCLLVIIVNSSTIALKNEIVSFISKNGKITELKDLTKDDWPIYVKKYFMLKNIEIDNDAVNEIVLRSNNDLNVFINEATKLILYKNNKITLKDVKTLMMAPLEENSFEILNNLLLNNKENALKIYRDLSLYNVEPISLIALISTSLIFYDEVYILEKQGLSGDTISSKLNANPYRVRMTLKTLRNVSYKRIRKALDDLYELDRSIKHSEVNRFYNFETFLLNF